MKLNKNIIILALTLIVAMLGFGMVIPIMPFYIEKLGASGSDLGLLMASYGVMHLIFSPLWGRLSDRIGRKPVIFIGMLGSGLAVLFFGLATELWMLFAARILSGILSSATSPAAMAYISDSTSPRERSGGIGILSAALGLGMILGPALGGLLAMDSLATPFFIAAGLSFVTLILILFFLPESHSLAAREKFQETEAGLHFKGLRHALAGSLGLLFFLAFLLSFGLTNFEGIFGLYALEKFNYGPEQIGVIFTVIALIATVTQGVLTGPLAKKFGEVKVIKASLLLGAVGFLLMLIPEGYPAVLLTTGFFVLSVTLLRPAVLALVSKKSGPRQGETLGLVNSFMSLGRIAGPIWAGFLFDWNYNYPYFSGALILLAGFLVALVKLHR